VSRLCLLACLVVLPAAASCGYLRGKPPEPVFRVVSKELPAPGTRVMVWAIESKSPYIGPAERRAEEEATSWLREHGVSVVKRSQAEQALSDERLPLDGGDPAALLTVGKLTGAQQVVLVQAYSDRVMVRAVDTGTGRMLWSGTGEYADADAEFDARARPPSLTRKTLDAIWKSKF
jgi:hypothetical protein